jgi:hypothetical protein
MNRLVEPEILDELPADDARAIHSRGDLQRINAWMGNARIMAHVLAENRVRSLASVAELGAGDGSMMLRLARRLALFANRTEVLLVDRQDLLTAQRAAEFRRIGWTPAATKMDVFDWLADGSHQKFDLIVANLFLHHFEEKPLRKLLEQASKRTTLFIACEPQRSSVSLLAARFLWLIGCNAVTRHDAVISIRAGFRDQELSGLWPQTGEWRLSEGVAGLASHWFCARHADAAR